MFTIQFQKCKVLVWSSQERLVTIFEDGAEVPACPNYDRESKARAVSLGYGSDLWGMTLDHELVHTILAEMDYDEKLLEEPISPALWAAAHPETRSYSEEESARFLEEEKRVFRLQRFHQLMKSFKREF